MKNLDKNGIWKPFTWTELSEAPRLRACLGTGTGGMLIRKAVFDKVPAPWFHWGEFSDDLFFCKKASAYGFPIYVDLDTPIGHTTIMNVWPGSKPDVAVEIEIDWLRLGLADDSNINEPPS